MQSVLILMQCLVANNEPQIFDAQDPRTPAVIYVASPKGSTSHLPASVYLDEAARVFSKRTSVALQSAEQAGIDPSAMLNCPFDQRLSCWTKTARKGADRANRYLFVLVVQVVSDGDRIAPFFIDLEAADRLMSQTELAPEALEDRLFDLAIQPTPGRIDPGDRRELSELLDTLLRRAFRETLDRNRHWEPYGTIEIEVDAPGATLELDGRVLGLLQAEHVRIDRVLAGDRKVGIHVPDDNPTFRPFASERALVVAPGSMSKVELERPPSRLNAWRPGLMVAGAASFVAGATILTVAGVLAGDETVGTCIARPGDNAGCEGLGAPSFGYAGTGSTPSFSSEQVNPAGVSMAAVGAGLAVAGATWAIGTWLFGDQEDLPWIQLGVGLAAGAATVGLGMAVDGR